jgi:trans-2,3-dihydro-3-hydroxyanthranilate isomerase
MQAIAREFNLSETVFVFPPESPANTRRLRIFTPAAEMPFAGHPTVGTAFLLAKIGAVPLAGRETRIVLEENVGLVPVLIKADTIVSGASKDDDDEVGGGPISARLTAAMAPQFGPKPPSKEALAEMLSLRPEDILEGEYSAQAVSCGAPFLFVPVRDRDALRRSRLVFSAWERTLAGYWAPQVFLLCFDPELPGSHLRARMYAPSLGVPEDPATGAAASALGGYLGVRQPAEDGEFTWIVEQGFEMGRPSILEVTAEKLDGAVIRVHVGGAAVLVSEGVMEVRLS